MANANNINGTPKKQVVLSEAPKLIPGTSNIGLAAKFVGGPKGTPDAAKGPQVIFKGGPKGAHKH